MIERVRIHAYAAPWMDGIYLLLRTEQGHEVATSINWQSDDGELRKKEPSCLLSFHEAQVLIDSLWDAGLRPSEGSGSAGSLRATEKHLADMRRIVAKKLGVEL